jgi:hypothetical protein
MPGKPGKRLTKPLAGRILSVRLGADEDARLAELEQASGKGASDIVRGLIRGAPNLKPLQPRRPLWDQKALTELARIGNNVNQIARELHRRDRQGVAAEEFAALDRALLQLVMVTMAGPEAAKQVMVEGLSAFMSRTSVQRMRGPSEPAGGR